MRATLFDYGAGNMHSLTKALARCGATVTIEIDPRRCLDTDLLVLPGVGAFGYAAERLAPGRDEMRAAILAGLPTVGVCLGMQLLFDGSDEGAGAGLGIIPGRIERFMGRHVPQIGWNSVEQAEGSPVAAADLPWAYYANSYIARPADASSVVAWSTHEAERFPAVVRANHAIGMQFHPEKSSAAGVAFLAAALQWCVR
jgi:glutamine amidotransferase